MPSGRGQQKPALKQIGSILLEASETNNVASAMRKLNMREQNSLRAFKFHQAKQFKLAKEIL